MMKKWREKDDDDVKSISKATRLAEMKKEKIDCDVKKYVEGPFILQVYDRHVDYEKLSKKFEVKPLKTDTWFRVTDKCRTSDRTLLSRYKICA